MSQNGKKGGNKGPGKEKNEQNGKTASNDSKEKDKDESANSSPLSSSQISDISFLDNPRKILLWCQKGEWTFVEQSVKTMQKSGPGGEVAVAPLAGLADATTGMTPLMYAAKDNKTHLIDKLIELGSDINARNTDNYNVLHIAAMYAREELVKLLLPKKGVNLALTGGTQNHNAVHLAASRPSATATAVMRALLPIAGKELKLKPDDKGKTPLLLAVEAGNQSMVRELLSADKSQQLKSVDSDGETAIHLAVRRKDIEMVRLLVDHGIGVDVRNADGQTALHIAAAEGDEAMVKYFYTVKASANVMDKQDRAPIHLAAENGHASVIEILVEKFKANISERTREGATLMHIVSNKGHADCASILVKKGVHLRMLDRYGAKSLHAAARSGHVGIVNTILEKGEYVDIRTNENYTALHIAVEASKAPVVESLLGYGADVHLEGGKLKETPLHIAARVPDGDRCALMLLKSGAGPNSTSHDDQTPVHVAAENGNLQTLILLLEFGGDPQFKNQRGETALHLASKSCKSEIVNHLIEYVKKYKGSIIAANYINELNNDDESALHYICTVTQDDVEVKPADQKIVKLLVENGSDVKLQTKQNETPFHYVAEAGNNVVLLEMITHMAPADVQKAVNHQNSTGWSPLLIASKKGHQEMVRHLLANNARVDVFDHEGKSALHLAAEQGFLQVCDSLLSSKAFINSKSRNGRTALHLAAMNGYVHLVKFLIKDHNAVIDILTLLKQTPLHLAAANGQIDVCRALLELGADIEATDEDGQKPIHTACHNNHSEVAKLFVQYRPSLVTAATKDGSTCAHIAAERGSVIVIEELMKFDKMGVLSARNKQTSATPLHIAAERGHAEVARVLILAGASVTDEVKGGFTAVHLAAQNGHSQVLEVLRSSNTLRVSSKNLGVTPLHVAAYFGQTDTARELLSYVPATIKSEAPDGPPLAQALGSESGMTPLHFAAFSGNENVVRLLLNSAGVQVDATTRENSYNAMHLACFGGHVTIVSLLLSRSADLLQSVDKHGKTGLHVSATHGHYQMVEVLLGQGAEINASDRSGWTALHCAAKAGFLEVVKLLTESGASPIAKTDQGLVPIWFAASEGHNDVLDFLLTKEHDTYGLMEDQRFVYNLVSCSKNHNNKPIEEFILVSPAPVDTAAKLSKIFLEMSYIEKGSPKHLIAAGKFCEAMGSELLALAAGPDSAAKILTATDRRNVEFLDVLIENEQKEVIAHSVVQRYLQEVWRGALDWAAWRLLLLFILFIICPPVWIAFTLPIGHRYHAVPIIKFMSYLTSHVYLMVFLQVVGVTPPYPVVRTTLLPYSYEWILLIWLSGLLLFELTNPTDLSGLGWIKLSVLYLSIGGVGLHLMGLLHLLDRYYWPTLLYCRDQLFAISFVLACVQILDFLSFHHLFGPWAIIIGNLMKDLTRFLAVCAIFIVGFSMAFVALNHPFRNGVVPSADSKLFSDVSKSPMMIFEELFFGVFGMTEIKNLMVEDRIYQEWTKNLFKIMFGIYMLVTVVVLINLLIAMMSDTYARIQAQSDIEWKYGLSKLIRSMHRTSSAPSPINLVTTWVLYLSKVCKRRAKTKKRESLVSLMTSFQRPHALSPRSKAAAIWLSKIRKHRIAPQESVPHLSPTRSQLSITVHTTSIEVVIDWEIVATKYRALMDEVKESQ